MLDLRSLGKITATLALQLLSLQLLQQGLLLTDAGDRFFFVVPLQVQTVTRALRSASSA